LGDSAGIRRIVTGHTPAGRSTIILDEVIAEGEIWSTSRLDLLGRYGPGPAEPLLPSTGTGLEPPPGGSRFKLATMQPWPVMQELLERAGIPGMDRRGFHRTLTIDYVRFLDGAVHLLLEEAQTLVNPGDLVIQRNTLHGWKNLTGRPVALLGLMVRV
jgi:hypothetical protein